MELKSRAMISSSAWNIVGALTVDVWGRPQSVLKPQDCLVEIKKALFPVMHQGRSTSKETTFLSRRGIPPSDLRRMLFQCKASPEEAKDRFDPEKKIVREKI